MTTNTLNVCLFLGVGSAANTRMPQLGRDVLVYVGCVLMISFFFFERGGGRIKRRVGMGSRVRSWKPCQDTDSHDVHARTRSIGEKLQATRDGADGLGAEISQLCHASGCTALQVEPVLRGREGESCCCFCAFSVRFFFFFFLVPV